MDMIKLLQKLMGYEPASKKQAQQWKKTQSATKKRRTATGVKRTTEQYREQSIPFGTRRYEQVPQEIFRMRSITGYVAGRPRSLESVFYAQGQYMEHYTDVYAENVICSRGMPTYANMKDDELRAYFSWRTLYRQGALPAAQSAFLLLYAYELLNLLGVHQNAELAYDRLCKLAEDYGEAFPAVRKQLCRWMQDFAAYYDLPYRCSDGREAALITILRHSTHTSMELLTALDSLSKYHILQSKLYQAEPERVAAVVQAVYRGMLQYYAEQKDIPYSSYLFGKQERHMHPMFEGAVFYEQQPHRDGAVRLSPLCVYHCHKGSWAKEVMCPSPHGDRIGALLRTIDAQLREVLHFKGKLKQEELPEGDACAIKAAIAAYFEEERKKNAPVIALDAGELEAIRQAAAHTTVMLTLPEDEEIPVAVPMTEVKAVETVEAPAEESVEALLPDWNLSKPAWTMLLCLLTESSLEPLRTEGQMLEVLADEINEGLYDIIGDTVIEMDGDTPVLVPDYIEELKGMVEG